MCYEQIRGIIVKNTPALLLLLLLLPPAILLVFSFSPVENYFFSSSDSGFQCQNGVFNVSNFIESD